MDSSSNQLSFSTLTGTYPATKLASGLTAGTDTLIATGATHGSIVTDILFRNADTSRYFDIIICATGDNAIAENSRVRISVTTYAGNDGATQLASLAALAPQLFDIDLAGNRVLTLESGISIYLRNQSDLAADLHITVKQRNF